VTLRHGTRTCSGQLQVKRRELRTSCHGLSSVKSQVTRHVYKQTGGFAECMIRVFLSKKKRVGPVVHRLLPVVRAVLRWRHPWRSCILCDAVRLNLEGLCLYRDVMLNQHRKSQEMAPKGVVQLKSPCRHKGVCYRCIRDTARSHV
jgi:hypothetical protein